MQLECLRNEIPQAGQDHMLQSEMQEMCAGGVRGSQKGATLDAREYKDEGIQGIVKIFSQIVGKGRIRQITRAQSNLTHTEMIS